MISQPFTTLCNNITDSWRGVIHIHTRTLQIYRDITLGYYFVRRTKDRKVKITEERNRHGKGRPHSRLTAPNANGKLKLCFGEENRIATLV